MKSPAVNIKTTSGDIELNSMKIANSVLGEAILLQSESGNIRYGSHIRYLICLHLFFKNDFYYQNFWTETESKVEPLKSLNGRTVGDITCHTNTGNISGGTLQSLTIRLTGNDMELQSAYAGKIFLNSSGSVKVKNMNGESEIKSKGDVLIDGVDGSLNVKEKIY